MSEELFDRAEFLRYFRDESDELLQLMEQDLLRLESAAPAPRADPDVVNSLFRALHTIKGSAGMLEIEGVARLAHRLEELCDLLRKERISLTVALTDVFFEGRDLLAAAARAEVEGREGPPGLGPFLERLPGFAANAPAGVAAEAPVLPQAVAGTEREAAARAGTIRVDVSRLDVLLDLVGELVINRTRIADIAATLGHQLLPPEVVPLVRQLGESAALLTRTTNVLQEAVMKMRMVPIGGVFERFPRFVHDLARTQHKEIELIVEGAQTDLDRTIVDRIGEPLMHLIRNCVDHGIGLPEQRSASGKPGGGTIWLRASHAGNQIVIEVADDGVGIDPERVRKRAVELGLVAAADAGSLLRNELFEIVFTPGFSTAVEVSHLSGRGVGMDVVRRAIARLGGTVEIDSVTGVGTHFTLKLPLTLAIAQALLVRVARELYAIPLDMTVESLRLEPGEIDTSRGIETIAVHEAVIPLIRLGEFFGQTPSPQRDEGQTLVVVTVAAGRYYGLVVDEFRGDQEIVIKPLSEWVGPVAGISGATILGDGSIALILDVSSLAAAAFDAGVRRASA